ncbi:MAG: DUF2469 family protein [Actinomycetota bacterium]
MSEEDLENFESDMEMALYREYRDVLPMFTYVVETERRFYLANTVGVDRDEHGWFTVVLTDAWVWDVYRSSRFVQQVKVMTRRDVNIEELARKDPLEGFDPPAAADRPGAPPG